MLPAIDAEGRSLVGLARTAMKFPVGHSEEYGTVCPGCYSLNAAIVCTHRTSGVGGASLACGNCGKSRTAWIDPIGAVGSEAP